MFSAIWRRWRTHQSSRPIRRNQPTGSRQARLALEHLERRDLLTVATPFFIVNPHGGVGPMSSPGPIGYTPSQISQAYGFNQISFSSNGSTVAGNGQGQTIAIVDAYDDPNITSDLQAFDKQFNLTAPTITSTYQYQANATTPTFTKVNQSGGTTLPAVDSGWTEEISLDVEWAHAIAPKANILLVEANSANFSDLIPAIQYAADQPGVVAVSMSWGSGEYQGETSYDSYFTTPSGHSGVSFIASSGDTGAPPSYPATSPNILAVGGTSLYLDSNNNWSSETAWSGSSGGISSQEAQPTYQQGIVTQSTTQRTNPDVAYDADPSTGFAVYDSFNFGSADPWAEIAGTSAAAPQWAALVAIADQGLQLAGKTSLDGPSQLLPQIYQMPSSNFHDITSGSSSGSPGYSAGVGYDLVTGRGTPIANLVVNSLVQAQTTGGNQTTNLIIDNGQSGYTETGTGWLTWTSGGYNGSVRYHHAGTGADTANWQASNLAAGSYTISATWNGSSNHATNATYQIYDGNGNLLATAVANQTKAPSGSVSGGVAFQNLATVTLSSAGSLKVVLSDNANGDVVADAVQFTSSSGSTSVPSAPTGLTATAVSSSQINLSWNAVSGASNGYVIDRSTNGTSGWTQIGTTASGVTTYSDTGLSAGTTYYYEVAAVNSAGTSPFSSVVSATTQSATGSTVTVDNGGSGYTETGTGWQTWMVGYNGSLRYHHAGTGADTASWKASNLAAGSYTIAATWNGSSNHATNATYQIYDGNGNLLATVVADQTKYPVGSVSGGVAFQKLATVTLSSAGSIKVVLSDNANGDVVADAVQFTSS